MDEYALRTVSQVGDQIIGQSRPIKDCLVRSLPVNALSQIEQPSVLRNTQQQEASNVEQSALAPIRTAIIKHSLAIHRDKYVKLLVGIVVSEMFRILAPEQPFEDKHLKEIFTLIVSIFEDLEDTSSPFFSKRVKILESVAQCRCCVIMQDIECHDLVYEMFNVLFSVVGPLLFVLRDLLNPAIIINKEMDLIRNTFLYLNIIFRAIRKAEDAVDKDKTVRLHILSEVGITFTNSLSRSSTHCHAPGMILFPLSMYKAATNSPVMDREFIKGIVKQFVKIPPRYAAAAARTLPMKDINFTERPKPTEQKRFKYGLGDMVNVLLPPTSGMLKEATGDIILKCKRKRGASSADAAAFPKIDWLAPEQENTILELNAAIPSLYLL